MGGPETFGVLATGDRRPGTLRGLPALALAAPAIAHIADLSCLFKPPQACSTKLLRDTDAESLKPSVNLVRL